MYSNDTTQIKMGLDNYIFSLVKSSKYEELATKQMVISILSEAIIKLSQDDNEVCDIQALKYYFKGIEYVINNRKLELEKLKTPLVEKQIQEYKELAKKINEFVGKF